MKSTKYMMSAILLLGLTATGFAQTQTEKDKAAAIEAAKLEKATLPKPYNETEDANKKIAELIKIAQKEEKNIFLQAGGNWCIWCRRFESFRQENKELKEMTENALIYYHLNFSPENKNSEVFARYGNPGEKYGYPVFIVLNKNGELVKVQSSEVLEDGKKGYDLEKTKEFLKAWAYQ